jgi:hypothetical protein
VGPQASAYNGYTAGDTCIDVGIMCTNTQKVPQTDKLGSDFALVQDKYSHPKQRSALTF